MNPMTASDVPRLRHPAKAPVPSSRPAAQARRRLMGTAGGPLFMADWLDALFLHFRVPAEVLRERVPFELDLLDGDAVVSLVAFRMEHFRCPALAFLGEAPWRPFAGQHFLNVRTYVRCGDEVGIHFLAEFLSSRLNVLLGPAAYGLPYRAAPVRVRRDGHEFAGGIEAGRRGRFRGSGRARGPFRPCAAGSTAEWLLERHTAFTRFVGLRRCFRIWHEPWEQEEVDVRELETSLIAAELPWWPEARLFAAHGSPGARDVWMTRPLRIPDPTAPDRNRPSYPPLP